MKFRRARRWLLVGVGALSLGSFSFLLGANARIDGASRGRSYSSVTSVPYHRVGLVLGTAPTVGAYRNSFFEGRISAAYELYHQGKVEKILVSGDNGSVYHDEPTAMKRALVKLRVPASDVVCDYAGFRTMDSMVRARKVFGLDSLTVVTDDFHMPRSLYFALAAGINADGYCSHAKANSMSTQVGFREWLARGRAVLDVEVFHSQPKFLGKPERI